MFCEIDEIYLTFGKFSELDAFRRSLTADRAATF